MKNLKYLWAPLLCLCLLVSCNTLTGDGAGSDGTTQPPVSDADSETTPDTDTETSESQIGVGGGVGSLDMYYDNRVCEFTYLVGTYMWENKDAIGEVAKTYRELYQDKLYKDNDYPAFLAYIVQEAEIPREAFEAYNAALAERSSSSVLPDEMIDALYSTDINEQRRVLKHPYTVYSDGHIYRFYDLEKLSSDELAALDVSEQEWADYIARIEEYMQERPSDMRRSVEFLRPLAGDATPTTTGAAEVSGAPEISGEPESSESQIGVGGGLDQFDQHYDNRVCGFTYIGYMWENKAAIGEVTKAYRELYQDKVLTDDRPPFLAYVVQEAEIPREVFDEYNIARGEVYGSQIILPDEMVDALYSTDVNEQRRVLKGPYSIYSDGHLYLFYDLEKLSSDELAALDVSEQEWADYIARIEEYMQERPSDMRRSVEFLRPLAGDATPTTTGAAEVSGAPEISGEPESSEA